MIKSNIIKHTNHLQAEIRENIGLIAFNRPESKNSLSDELTPALRTTLENFESNKDVRVILITGNGGAFCSWGDVKSFANNSDPGLSSDLSVEQKVRKLQIGQEGVSLKIHEMHVYAELLVDIFSEIIIKPSRPTSKKGVLNYDLKK